MLRHRIYTLFKARNIYAFNSRTHNESLHSDCRIFHSRKVFGLHLVVVCLQ